MQNAVARHQELARLSAFVTEPLTAGALVIEGPAGIGKTTLRTREVSD